jgi:hypothetical protein
MFETFAELGLLEAFEAADPSEFTGNNRSVISQRVAFLGGSLGLVTCHPKDGEVFMELILDGGLPEPGRK